MSITVKEIKVAYITGSISESLMDEMTEMDAPMYNDNGGGQYPINTLKNRFDEDSDEYRDLEELESLGYSYIEYS